MQHPAPGFFRRHGLILTAVTGAVIALAACGGGGGGTTSASNPTVTYSGTVTGLGSIVVNGVRFSTIGANTTDPDDPTQSYGDAFALGSSVTVTGTIDPNTGTVGQATAIVVHGGVRGVVSAVDTLSNTLVVAGQLVRVDANTVYADGASLASLNGQSVEVHGTVNASNELLAARVELENTAGKTYPYAVVGRVSSVNTVSGTFQLVLATQTLTLPTPTGVTPSHGMTVRVLSTVDPAGTTVLDGTNTKVIIKDERSLSGETKIRGAITSLAPLTINDIVVDTTQNPKWDDGLTANALAVGQIIKVEGRMSNGTLIAREIEADEYEYKSSSQYQDRVKLYGVVSAVNGSTFVVQGVTVTLSSGTPPAEGSYVEVKAHLVNGVLTAHEVENKTSTATSRFETYGTASCGNGLNDLRVSNFTLMTTQGSLTVNGSAAREVKYDDDARNTTGTGSYSCFLEVEGNVSGGVIQATKIEVKQRNLSAS